jgi:hypothetical protein
LSGKQRRVRASDSYQIAKEKLRQFKSAQARGENLPLPISRDLGKQALAMAEQTGRFTVFEHGFEKRPRCSRRAISFAGE